MLGVMCPCLWVELCHCWAANGDDEYFCFWKNGGRVVCMLEKKRMGVRAGIPVAVRWIRDSSADDSSPCSVMLCSLFQAARMWTLTKTLSSSLAAILFMAVGNELLFREVVGVCVSGCRCDSVGCRGRIGREERRRESEEERSGRRRRKDGRKRG